MTNLAPETPPPAAGPRGGGCLIAAGLLLGPLVGLYFGETSIGLLAGLAVGVLAAVALMLAEARR